MVSYGITFEKNNMINELHRSPEQGSDAFLFVRITFEVRKQYVIVVSFGIYFSRSLTVSVLEPITAIFINKALPLFMNPLWVHFYIIAQQGLIINP